MTATDLFLRARDHLLATRDDHDRACAGFSWPALEHFNWAIDWFDVYARGNTRRALWIVDASGAETTATFAELSERSTRVAHFLHGLGVERGARVLVMLPNVLPLWEVLLGAAKIGAVIIPATTQLTAEDVADRLTRGDVRCVVAESAVADRFGAVDPRVVRIAVGEPVEGWTRYDDAYAAPATLPTSATPTGATDPLLLYFTSGTTAKPKLVLHTHQSYPVGHLSTMYWVGLREGDTHLNISSPGWAKHAWSSVFAPWNAGATVLVHAYKRFVPTATLDLLARCKVDTLCAPPTVWRMLILENLAAHSVVLREAVSAGEPLNPEIIDAVRRAWNLTVRDGYGQTETTAQIGNTPGMTVVPGTMGRPLPGYTVALLDAEGRAGAEGEIALALDPRPMGLMAGYLDDEARTADVTAGGYYRTGDEAVRDAAGLYTFVGRGDDVFKSSDYRISPFELESALLEHPAVAEAAVVPSPDPVRTSVPKAFVVLAPGIAPTQGTAQAILQFARERLAPYKRVRRIEFTELPKTISGKIRRVELRKLEAARRARNERGALEWTTEDFGEGRG
ncbi:AMP-binding protein [Polyangium sorediatum]|uniref:AMP-binding protein n=1 Tax=Polyangium sorediatum TaxID=889274 RepID=A0ABT6P6Z8_9BACT|nr:AMP-binding protein [Polyangium sorediatum]MDI1436391.1 AMP-binding protein [Polyangium sorediatum]